MNLVCSNSGRWQGRPLSDRGREDPVRRACHPMSLVTQLSPSLFEHSAKKKEKSKKTKTKTDHARSQCVVARNGVSPLGAFWYYLVGT